MKINKTIGIKEEIFIPLKAYCAKYAINLTGLINNLLKDYLEAHKDPSEYMDNCKSRNKNNRS